MFEQDSNEGRLYHIDSILVYLINQKFVEL
jgi:hypothetical protein